MTNERGTVISDRNDKITMTVNIIVNDNERDKSESNRVGEGDRLPHTLTHSLTLSHIPLLTIINIHYHYNSHICNLDNLYFDDDH